MKVLFNYLMTTLILTFLANGIQAQCNSATNQAYKENWRLVFYDEFDSLGLNPQKWSNSFPWGRWTHGLHYNTDAQNFIYNGSHLVLKTNDDTITGLVMNWDSLGNYLPYLNHFDYTSGMIYSNRCFKYGFFESKVKIPTSKGLNAGFWLYGPNACEIDVFEIQGSTPNNAQMTLHWDGLDSVTLSSQRAYHTFTIDSNFAEKEYIFGVKWKKDELVWYIDNNEIMEDFYTRLVRSRHIPQVDMNVIFTCEVGTMDGNPDSTSTFPAFYNIDYLRAYSEDTVAPPIITGQIPISISYFSSLTIVPNMLIVDDFYHTYPAGFKVIVMSGANYTLNGNVITPLHNDIDTLYVALKVNDGIDNSPVYYLMVQLPDANFVEENQYNKNLILYPNPADKYLKIRISSKDEKIDFVDIFDVKGKHCIQTRINDQCMIDISNLAQGMYFVAVTTNKGKRMLKFVKK